MKFLNKKEPFDSSEKIIFEIKYPEITKNMSTPNHPPLKNLISE